MKSRLFKIAHSIRADFATFGEALRHAWCVVKLQVELCIRSAVSFTYLKVDGSIRKAVGTLDNVPTPKGGFRKNNYGLLAYFDRQQNDWRSCRIANLIF